MKKIYNNKLLYVWCNPKTDVRIQVLDWHEFSSINEQYIIHPKKFKFVWNYTRRIGVLAVIRKIFSRINEVARNQKVVACGLGIVVQIPVNSEFKLGQEVIFFASNHTTSQMYICIDKVFVLPFLNIDDKFKNLDFDFPIPKELQPYVGWSPFSGKLVNVNDILGGLQLIRDYYQYKKIQKISVINSLILESSSTPIILRSDNRPAVVLFGLGNYAKTVIIPNIKKNVNLCKVHEIDPLQLTYFKNNHKLSLDTSPYPNNEDPFFDAWFIAGFHHTHADLAITALKKGAYAVIEKPIATTWGQFFDLKNLIERDSNSRFFSCFHKRYSKFNDWVLRDLNTTNDAPIDMHCIVYEVPLPKLHWYNWPNSGSRLISNGCHWIDYFMFVNSYVGVEDLGVRKLRGNDLSVNIKLINGANFSMILTDTGSQRLGVRDYIELRNGAVTVKMIDGHIYESEDRFKIIHRGKISPMGTYKRMYKSISNSIAMKEDGDSIKSLLSTQVTLSLEELIPTK